MSIKEDAMIKKIITGLVLSVNFSAFACTNAMPTDHPSFCATFKTAATCYCTASGLPFGMCQDMHVLYNRMIVVFKTLEKACEYQKYTTTQDCIDNWRCYLAGGKDSQGRTCSSTSFPCE